MEVRIIASNEKLFTESEMKNLEAFHIERLEKERKEKTRILCELQNARSLISRLTERIIVNDVEHMLNEWMESEFEGTESEDRKRFAKKVVNYLSNVQHT